MNLVTQSTTRRDTKNKIDFFVDDKDLFQKLMQSEEKPFFSPELLTSNREAANDYLSYTESMKNSPPTKKKSLSPIRFDIPQPSKLVLFQMINPN